MIDSSTPAFARFEQVAIVSDRPHLKKSVGREGTVIWHDLMTPGRDTQRPQQWNYVVQLATENTCVTCLESDICSTGQFDSEDMHLGKCYEISFDLVCEEENDFAEGSYRLPGRFWEVFVISKRDVENVKYQPGEWPSGIQGLMIHVPRHSRLDQQYVLTLMRERFKNSVWSIVRGPDSIVLR